MTSHPKAPERCPECEGRGLLLSCPRCHRLSVSKMQRVVDDPQFGLNGGPRPSEKPAEPAFIGVDRAVPGTDRTVVHEKPAEADRLKKSWQDLSIASVTAIEALVKDVHRLNEEIERHAQVDYGAQKAKEYKAHNDWLKKALGRAKEEIHMEFCGSECHPVHLEIEKLERGE